MLAEEGLDTGPGVCGGHRVWAGSEDPLGEEAHGGRPRFGVVEEECPAVGYSLTSCGTPARSSAPSGTAAAPTRERSLPP